MYDLEYPGLDGKVADKYPKLNTPDWPEDFPKEADTSAEWVLTQEMVGFWAAYKPKKETVNPTLPLDINQASFTADNGGEIDRSFADFECEEE
ncbi:hypothetical protein C0991_002557, partial [Blastosporella zonata]